jgi:hypothetical protein
MTTIRGSLLSALAALVVAGAAQGGLEVGVTEDAGKNDGGASFFGALADVGLKVNRVSINWDASAPLTIPSEVEIAAWLPQALATNTRILFAVAPLKARAITESPSARADFAAFLRKLAERFPQVTDYVIGNEPNQPLFWLPQFGPTGTPLSAAAYLPVLADAYDTLKAVNPAIRVAGVGLSPRGNDLPNAKSNVSRSPIRFLHDLGVAFRASRRTKPIMDELAFHPYPARNNDAPAVGYNWPNAGLPDLARLKQALWDAFRGTAQPTPAETGKTSVAPLNLDLDEVGWQVQIRPELATFYFGAESPGLIPIDEQTQADYYRETIEVAACDPSVRLLSFFHLSDEPNLGRWQSGLLRADGSRRPAYDTIKQTLSETKGDCQGAQTTWRHTTQVVLPFVAWGKLQKPRPLKQKRWSFTAGAREEASFRAAIFKAGPSKGVLARRLATGRPKPVLSANGSIKAKARVVYFPARRLKPGRYVFAIRMTAAMNPQRVSVFVSKAFRVGTRR